MELAAEGGVDAWVAEREADGAVGGDDFEKDGEGREGLHGVSWWAFAGSGHDAEETER